MHASVWTMLACIRTQNFINLYHLVIKLGAINNDRTTAKEWTAAEATGGLNALWRQIFALDSVWFLLKHKREDFLLMQNIITEKQTINDLVEQRK